LQVVDTKRMKREKHNERKRARGVIRRNNKKGV